MVEIVDNINWIGVNDRRTDLFEGLWPLPNGISYNSYLIEDEKTVLVDTVKSSFEDELLENIEKRTDPSEIDYIGEFKGKPSEEDLEKGRKMGKAVAEKVTS